MSPWNAFDILAAILAAGLAASCCEADQAPSCSIGGSVLRSQGSLGFELGDDLYGTWSKLDWPVDGMLGRVEGGVTFPVNGNCAVLLNARYDRSLSLDGTGRDWDWRPWEQPGVVSDYSETDSSGTLQALDLRAGFRFPVAYGVNLQFIAGYSRSSVDFEDDHLVGSYDYGRTPIDYPGLAATYAAEFSGFFIGGEVEARVWDKLTLSAEVDATASLSATADGNWVRRGMLFSQDASGTGLTLAGKAGYEIRKNVTLTAQVGWTSQTAKDGEQSGTQDGVPYVMQIVEKMSLKYATAGIGVVVEY